MATWTQAQVVNAALERLGVKAKGQSAAAEDYSAMNNAYLSLYPQLRRKGHAPWAIGEVEEEAQQPLIDVLAGALAGEYGFTGQRRAELAAAARQGKRDLAEQAAGDKHPVPIVAEYF